MGGTSKSTQQQSTSSQTNPWAPTQGLLTNIIGGIGNTPMGASAGQTNALSNMSGAVSNLPSYAPQTQGVANNLLTGGQNYGGVLSGAYGDLQNQLNPVANASLDPTQTPGMANALSTIQNDVGNSVNGMFAGAGRDMSGMNQQSLARGIAQGEAQPLLNQYNQNVQNRSNAANSLYQGGANTASGLSALQQTGFGNQLQGLDVGVNGLPAAAMAPGQAQLGVANQQYQQPLQNLGMMEGLTVPIAGLGGQSTGTGSMQGSNTMSGADRWNKIATPITSMFRFGGGG